MIIKVISLSCQCCSQNMLFTSNELKITLLRIIQAKRSFVNVETGSRELAILSYATVCPYPSVSLNNEKKMS